VRAIIDGRGMNFCDECIHFLKKLQPVQQRLAELMKDKVYLHYPPSGDQRTEGKKVGRLGKN